MDDENQKKCEKANRVFGTNFDMTELNRRIEKHDEPVGDSKATLVILSSASAELNDTTWANCEGSA